MLERFRLPQAGKRFSLDLLHKANNPQRLRAVFLNPPSQILEGWAVKFDRSHIPSFSLTASSERPSRRSAAARRRSFIAFDFRRYAVSRSEATSRHNSMGTMTARSLPRLHWRQSGCPPPAQFQFIMLSIITARNPGNPENYCLTTKGHPQYVRKDQGECKNNRRSQALRT